MNLRDQILTDRDTVFLNSEDFAEPITVTHTDLTTTTSMLGIWTEIPGNEISREHDTVAQRFATLRIKRELMPTTDPYRCRFVRDSAPDEIFAVRALSFPISGLARLDLAQVTVEDRHVRDGYLVVRGGRA